MTSEPLTVRAKQAAEILGISERSFYRTLPALTGATVVFPGTKERRYVVERLREFILTLADCQ